MCFFFALFVVTLCSSNHFTCSEETREKISSPSASQVAFASSWDPCVDFPTTCKALLRSGQAPLEGHSIFVQDQGSHDELVQRPVALRLLQKAEQSPRRTVRGMQDPMGSLYRYLLHSGQEEGDGADPRRLVWQGEKSGSWSKGTDPQCFPQEARSSAARQSEAADSAWAWEEGQGEGIRVTIPTHWRSTAPLAWIGHGIHPCKWWTSALSICATSSTATSNLATTAFSGGTQPVGGRGQEALSRSQQDPCRDSRSPGEVRSHEHPAGGGSTSQSHQSSEAIQRQDEGATRISSAAQGFLAEAPKRRLHAGKDRFRRIPTSRTPTKR